MTLILRYRIHHCITEEQAEERTSAAVSHDYSFSSALCFCKHKESGLNSHKNPNSFFLRTQYNNYLKIN